MSVGYSVYCEKCREMTPAHFKVRDLCALCEVERLRAELAQRHEGCVCQETLLATQGERDEAREAAKYLYGSAKDEGVPVAYCAERWPWLKD